MQYIACSARFLGVAGSNPAPSDHNMGEFGMLVVVYEMPDYEVPEA